jgi:hypothetical protein
VKTDNTRKIIGEIFLEIADAIEMGHFGDKTRIGLTTLGSEHGIENLIKGAEIAALKESDLEVVLIGSVVATNLEIHEANTEEEMLIKMEELLDSGYLDGCITMHYNFPIGVSTVGKVVTPGLGKEMFIATTTGTSATNRIEAMIRNAINGIIAAKATGIENPTLGILNLDGARQVEIALKKLNDNGYNINFGESQRSDRGLIMRGNDLLTGSVDVMVADTLTGNILMKMFSSYTTGGSYESAGYGYGPGIGENYNRKILILSRASGTPVVVNAIRYGVSVARGRILEISEEEYKEAKKAGLDKILIELNKVRVNGEDQLKQPEREVVTGQISGIDIMDLEDAVKVLRKLGIYAESGMGCTGPIVMVNESRISKVVEILARENFITGK